jgi:integrase
MPREALEPGEFPPKHKIRPIKGADGVWRLTNIRHRTISGSYVRTSAQGRTKDECLQEFTRRWEVNNRKGSVRQRLRDTTKFSQTDKLSTLFARFDADQKAKAESGKIKHYTYEVYHRSIYPMKGGKAGAIKLDTELGGYTIGEMGVPAELHAYLCDIADLSPATAYRHHNILRVCYRIVTLEGMYTVSPMSQVPTPDVTVANPQRALTEDERYGLVYMLRRKEDWVAGHNYVVAFALTMLGTGLRPGEALALRWCDLPDLDDLDVDKAVMYVGGTMIRRRGMDAERQESRKTGEGSEYWITLPKWLTRELRAWKHICRPASEAEHLFTIDGRPLTVGRSHNSLEKLRAGTSMEWFSWGNLRDTVATEVAKRSGDDMHAAAQLGHSAGATFTSRHYIDRRGWVHVTVDNSKWLEFLYPGESDSNVTILESIHGPESS